MAHRLLDGRAGVGFGRLRLTNASGVVAKANGTTLTVSVGGSTEKRLLLGVEGQIWSGATAGPRQRISSVIVVAQWYPFSTRGDSSCAAARVS